MSAAELEKPAYIKKFNNKKKHYLTILLIGLNNAVMNDKEYFESIINFSDNDSDNIALCQSIVNNLNEQKYVASWGRYNNYSENYGKYYVKVTYKCFTKKQSGLKNIFC